MEAGGAGLADFGSFSLLMQKVLLSPPVPRCSDRPARREGRNGQSWLFNRAGGVSRGLSLLWGSSPGGKGVVCRVWVLQHPGVSPRWEGG